MQIIERTNDSHKILEIDKLVKNKFKWEWLETTVDVNKKAIPLSEWIRKIDCPGKAKCIPCEKIVNYGSRGKVSLVEHCNSVDHISKVKTLSSNERLPSSFTGVGNKNDAHYGIHPMFVSKIQTTTSSESTTKPVTSFEDRTAQAQALILGVVAEHSLPMTMVPVLIDLAQKLSKDKKVLDGLSMDRTSASYKMTYGLKRTFHTQTLQSIREQAFSLNIVEATSNNNKKVLSVLVSYFSKTEGRVVVEHLAALELENCKTSTIFEALCDLFELNQIPWTNLVSILMDSCAVMRGSKNGLERRIREEKAPNLLDIDGDVCHHIHNGTKKFCAPFDSWVEDLFSALCTDHKYCVDLRDSLAEVCNLLGIKFTAPERFLSHRWLSAYDLAVSTLRMWSAYQVFYYAFIDKAFKADYWPVVKAILVACKVSQPAKERIKAIIAEVGAKKMTADGQKRKKEIVEKVMFQERKTLLILNFYASVLPIMKRYVVLFQSKEPLVHRLNDEQVDVFREFLSCFVKQEHIVNKNGKQLKNMDLSEDTGLYLSADDMFVGSKAKQIMKGETKKDSVSENFKKLAITSYMATGVYLQQKLPLDNPVLRRLSALDPLAHGHSATLKALKQLPSLLPNRLNQEETDSYEDEVHRFQVDQHLPDPEQRLDEWWGNVFVAGKYPALSKVALLACTVFHGPMVESSFNTMGDIIGVKSASVTVETYASIQTVKYFLKARNTTALSYFDRVDVLYSPVNHILAVNMKTASASYRASLKAKREETDENNRLLDRNTPKPLSKVQTLLNMRSQAQQEWQSHEDQQKKQAQKRLLKDLAFKKRIQ